MKEAAIDKYKEVAETELKKLAKSSGIKSRGD